MKFNSSIYQTDTSLDSKAINHKIPSFRVQKSNTIQPDTLTVSRYREKERKKEEGQNKIYRNLARNNHLVTTSLLVLDFDKKKSSSKGLPISRTTRVYPPFHG